MSRIAFSAMLLTLPLVWSCSEQSSGKPADTSPFPSLEQDGKADETGKPVQFGGEILFGQPAQALLPDGGYVAYQFVAQGGARVRIDAVGTRDHECTEECVACWQIDTVAYLHGPLVDGEPGGFQTQNDDTNGATCDLGSHIEAELPTAGTYQILVRDFNDRSGTVTVALECDSGSCQIDCDQSCPAGSVCGDQRCVPEATGAEEEQDADGDILLTDLSVHVRDQRATATIDIVPAADGRVALEVGGLHLESVAQGDEPLAHEVRDGLLELSFPDRSEPVTLTITYTYDEHELPQGAVDGGYTVTSPYYCGNLFPCQSSPAEGSQFSLSLEGFPASQRAVYPESIPTDAPAYMLAWTVGRYRYMDLGTTAAGTHLGAYLPSGYEPQILVGTNHLVEVFEWLETTIGPYTFGTEVATVSVPWSPAIYGGQGGMEHHPFWHVSQASLDNDEIHCHEAVHGWFGNGVRFRCWEDFVLSEGTTSYLTARAMEVVAGAQAGEDIWQAYSDRLDAAMESGMPQVAWPDSCGELDLLQDGLFTPIPYMKGAFFFRAVARRVGPDALDAALAAFYQENVGQATGMQQLLDTIAAQTGYDPTTCAQAWLRDEQVPTFDACP